MVAFENVVAYFLVFIIFVVGFLPIMQGYIIQTQAITDNITATFLGFLVPFILVAFVVAFFIRLKGEKPFGEF